MIRPGRGEEVVHAGEERRDGGLIHRWCVVSDGVRLEGGPKEWGDERAGWKVTGPPRRREYSWRPCGGEVVWRGGAQ